MANRLARSSSPYLRQHADNPVHWQEWTPEALAEAAERDVPILLSIGYAACHWCHVMAHGSFEDAQVAEAMNADFVCIKVDREERPDLDAIYMNATIALTGRGGWPMTCFLTPDGQPFYCGTYYPKDTFLNLLSAIVSTWRERRGEVQDASQRITDELRAMTAGLSGGGPPVDAMLCDAAVAAVLREEDTERGGFGGAPKFPPSALMETLLRHFERTATRPALDAVARAGAAMARGGIYDQLAGGFARYSVDNAWVVPHFEKMLYDNALLLRAYAHWARRTGDPLAIRVASATARFLLDELSYGGMFVSSLDADADGREGSTYVWTREQLIDVLGDDDGRWAADVFGVTPGGTFEPGGSARLDGGEGKLGPPNETGGSARLDGGEGKLGPPNEFGSSVLQLRADPDDQARLDRVRAALLVARRGRVQPARDDKVVTVWNGMAITALVEAGVALGDSSLISAAQGCAAALVDLHLVDGRLRRASLGGYVGEPAAILEDYGALVTGLLSVYQLSADQHWLTTATGLLDTALAHFADPDSPGRWFDSADDAEALMLRPADPMDGATPSGAALIAEALLTATHLVDAEHGERYRRAAADALAAHSALLARSPRSVGHWLAVAEAYVAGPLQVAVSCQGSESVLLSQARRLAPGGAIVVGGAAGSSELLVGRDRVADADAAYVCRGPVCDLPVSSVTQLAAALGVPETPAPGVACGT